MSELIDLRKAHEAYLRDENKANEAREVRDQILLELVAKGITKTRIAQEMDVPWISVYAICKRHEARANK